MGIYLLSTANIILVGEIAGSMYLLNNKHFLLILHALLAGVAFPVWRRTGQPSLAGPFHGTDFTLVLSKENLAASLARNPSIWCLGTGVVLVYLYNALLIIGVPPNNYDSMTTHMARVAYWLQYGSLFPWPTPNIFQTTDPVNNQLCIYWSVLFWGSDQLAGFIQWISIPVSIVAIYGLAIILGFSRRQSLLAALVWATFPEVVFQSTTTQTHLAASARFVAGLYLLYAGLKSDEKPLLYLSALAFGLAVGTSQYIILAMPGLILAVLMILARCNTKAHLRKMVLWGAACIFFTLLVGSYMYIVNTVIHANPFGPADIVSSNSSSKSAPLLTSVFINSCRFLYQAFDLTTGLASNTVAAYLNTFKATTAGHIFDFLHIPIEDVSTTYLASTAPFMLTKAASNYLHEDYSWFGPVSALVLFPAMLYQFWLGITKKEPYRLGLIIIAFGLLITVAGFVGGWTPHKNRYFILAASACAPLAASAFNGKDKWAVQNLLIAFFSLMVLVVSALFNNAKPVLKIWHLDRIAMQSFQFKAMEPVIRMVERNVPRDGKLGLIHGGDDWNYPFFGDSYTRKIYQIYPQPQFDQKEWLPRTHYIKYLLINTKNFERVNMPAALRLLAQSGDWNLFLIGHNISLASGNKTE